uniref:Uncharacterized protein n=1 Tax=Daphnia galeata TaxID=27404 RepID=A0A8J2S2S2_9CRUS|nr:unnamed protein product [Daphnia galeata]
MCYIPRITALPTSSPILLHVAETKKNQVRKCLKQLTIPKHVPKMKEGCHKKDFYLSLPDQFYTITYHLKYSDIKLKPYRYSVTVEASSTHGEYSDEEQTSFETNSSIHSQPSQSQSNDLLELDITFCPKWQEFHAPVYMWINTDRSSTHGNKSLSCLLSYETRRISSAFLFQFRSFGHGPAGHGKELTPIMKWITDKHLGKEYNEQCCGR